MLNNFSFRVSKNIKVDVLKTSSQTQIPIIPTSKFSTPISGGILYEPTFEKLYFGTGTQWKQVNGGGGSGNSTSFSLIKFGEQTIIPNTDTIVSNWTDLPSPPYHDNTSNWDVASGIYTATESSTLFINVNISWKAGINNLGDRIVKILYKNGVNPPIVAKESVTQADANTAVETTQETGIALALLVGDQAWVEVRHTSPVNLVISTGNHTSISGIKMNV
jgi:hypothetical protein